ncbi:MAG TPA: polyprenyl synthetase family protein [Clostridia bacterium]|nr:polyprenyl synthetase family protein [Clostridia bacterium]
MNNDYLKYIEENLQIAFDNIKDKYPTKLYDAMEYSVFSGGKRIRPYLMLLVADFLNISHDKVINQAVALELIHSYSLIHDDLPGMDNDDYRRGKPTCHKKFGEAMAILAGDALLNLAYETLFKASLHNTSITKSCYFLAQNAGGIGMIGGQALEFSNLTIDLPLYEKICSLKTGKLITSATLCPAYISATKEEFDALQTFGTNLGLIFQLVDDLLDIDTDKTSFVKFTDTSIVRKKLSNLSDEAIQSIASFGKRNENLINFCNFLTKRTK